MTRSLNAMKPGERGKIAGVSRVGNESFALRLQEMGLTVGCEIEVAHFSPLGGTLAVRARSTTIAIRSEDARLIDVERI